MGRASRPPAFQKECASDGSWQIFGYIGENFLTGECRAPSTFVTWRLRADRTDLNSREKSLVVETLHHSTNADYDLLAYVVMNDHAHVLIHPKEDKLLQDTVHSWKSFSSHKIGRLRSLRGGIWQDEYFDRIIRSDEELHEKAKYILDNPWKRWPDIAEYPWVGFHSEG